MPYCNFYMLPTHKCASKLTFLEIDQNLCHYRQTAWSIHWWCYSMLMQWPPWLFYCWILWCSSYFEFSGFVWWMVVCAQDAFNPLGLNWAREEKWQRAYQSGTVFFLLAPHLTWQVATRATGWRYCDQMPLFSTSVTRAEFGFNIRKAESACILFVLM